jgi:hypothetical protein
MSRQNLQADAEPITSRVERVFEDIPPERIAVEERRRRVKERYIEEQIKQQEREEQLATRSKQQAIESRIYPIAASKAAKGAANMIVRPILTFLTFVFSWFIAVRILKAILPMAHTTRLIFAVVVAAMVAFIASAMLNVEDS